MKRPATLSATFVKTVRQPGRYGDGRGGHGLTLLVKPTRIKGRLSKTWSQRVRIGGRETNLGLGSFPSVTLAEARRRAVTNRQAIEEGRDPRDPSIPTFQQAANKVIDHHSAKWRAGGTTRQDWESTLENYVYPTMGSKGVDEIASADVMACVAPIWHTKADTAKRVRQRISAVLKWAIAQGYRRDDPTEAITAALGKNTAKRRHYKAIPHAKVAEALDAIAASRASKGTIYCLEFLTLCAVRSGEARLATWDEIDLKSATWTIPGHRTKTDEEHRVPLSTGALAVLNKASELSDGTGLVFPSTGGRAMSDVTMSKLCRDLGIGGTPHGMRAAFRSWAAGKRSRLGSCRTLPRTPGRNRRRTAPTNAPTSSIHAANSCKPGPNTYKDPPTPHRTGLPIPQPAKTHKGSGLCVRSRAVAAAAQLPSRQGLGTRCGGTVLRAPYQPLRGVVFHTDRGAQGGFVVATLLSCGPRSSPGPCPCRHTPPRSQPMPTPDRHLPPPTAPATGGPGDASPPEPPRYPPGPRCSDAIPPHDDATPP